MANNTMHPDGLQQSNSDLLPGTPTTSYASPGISPMTLVGNQSIHTTSPPFNPILDPLLQGIGSPLSNGFPGGQGMSPLNQVQLQRWQLLQQQQQQAILLQVQARRAAAEASGGQPNVVLGQDAAIQELMEEIGKMAQEEVEETVSNEVFSSYHNHEVLPGCRPHPGDIVEAGSLSALKLPDVTYPLADSLPKADIEEGKLSSLQLEGIVHACQRHQVILPNGNRAGFFLGDAAGVGKGRQISGVILDNYARARTKHIWFSISTDLIVDARRDLGDIGCFVKVIDGCQQLDRETRVLGLPADFKEGVVFSTYATLVSSTSKGGTFSSSRQSRLQQLVDWCGGKDFEGCLIFDECHKAKNFVPGKDQASTKVALAVTGLQRMLPRARVLYCSATGVSDVKNMAFMERLGLWGEGAPFKSFDQFLETVQRKGLGVAEMLAMEMKSSGMYVSRSLSFKQAEFSTTQISLTKEQVKMYNTAAHVWNEVRKSLETAIDRTGCTSTRMWSAFWAAHQRFFKQLCMGIKVPAIVEEATEALESGYSVVIGLQTTGEASLESEISKSRDSLTDFVSLCREILTRFISQHFPTVIESTSNDPKQILTEDDWSQTAKQMLLGFAKQIQLPYSPLDEIIDKLGGPDQVAEMTGRRGRVVRASPRETPRYELRDSDSGNVDSLNVRERNLFMEGKRFVAIISDAASTGISLHADQRAANQRRRVHLTIELPWSADKAVQQLGRSHRSNQSSGPLYKLMTTNLGGEKRFAAAVARRLQSLGALTRGDRRAATGQDLAEFNFDTPYGRSALKAMYSAICQKHLANGVSLSSVTMDKFDFAKFNEEMTECLSLMGILEKESFASLAKVKDSVGGDVGKFLNRILGLSVGRQNLIFNYFSRCLDAQVSMAKREGRYNEGLVDISATSVEMLGRPREVFKSRGGSSNPTKHVVVTVDRGMSWECARQRNANHPGPDNGFFCSRRETRGRKFYVLATLKEGSSHLYKIARPNTGVSGFDEDKSDLLSKYTAISMEKAEAGWKSQYESAKEQCIHGPNCRAGKTCKVGTRRYRMHLLCGGIVTLMSILETTIARYGPKLQLSKAESTLRVVRVQLNSGDRVVGIRYPEMLIPLVEKTIQEEDVIRSLMAKQQGVLTNDVQLALPPPGGVGGSPTATPSSDGATPKLAMTEPVAPVAARCLLKATTPPVTIKSFFKAVSNAGQRKTGNGNYVIGGAATEEATTPTAQLKSRANDDVITDIAAASMTSSSTSSSSACDSIPATSGSRAGTSPRALTSPSTVRSQAVNCLSSKDVKTKPAQVVTPQSKGTKRLHDPLGGAKSAKRPKTAPRQGSIFDSFAKLKTKAAKTDSVKKCPICGIGFPDDVTNTDVNKHVDNCLIK